MSTALTVKNKISFVDGSQLRPKSDDLLYESWVRRNVTIKSFCSIVKLPNNLDIPVTQIGSVQLFPELTLQNVLFVPIFKFNLLSISSFTKHVPCSVSFSSESCQI
ncbi:hypothetical protein F511_21664 [Dorcoceras hygrometricum]|uniref:Retrovirus-related Pol polyprotein from transposon TNT 1-94-like beta-barrel domain-containing protein n=1 Tax=Dorcoceras hygrometricum TaxID=472368 RepID=A0A2Z7B6G1_9LAMI|nr:hypothetical protein F511_21664 [Dorcoceras hygrometricum]